MGASGLKPRWGDINGFFGLLVDNAAALVLLYTLLASPGFRVDRFSPQFVLAWMVPGTAAGVLLGAVLYAFLAWLLARRTGRSDVTAMPVGLDTPSVFAVSLFVLVPSLTEGRVLFGNRGLPDLELHQLASVYAWHVGVAVLVMLGIIKIVLAPIGQLVRRMVPRAALLGSLAAISLALIAFVPLARHVALAPVVGIPVLMIILTTFLSGRADHDRIPGSVLAVGFGIAIVLLSIVLGNFGRLEFVPLSDLSLLKPGKVMPLEAEVWTTDWWEGVVKAALYKLPIALPFALFTVIGGIECAESAAAAGDDYDARSVLFVQGIATAVAGLLGGVVQTTPYFGHPAYKKMGAGWAYVVLATLVLVLIGYFGWFAHLFEGLPGAVFFPLVVYIGLRTIAHSFEATPPRDYAAMAIAALPVLAYLTVITADEVFGGSKPHQSGVLLWQALRCLGNGFILTSLLWALAVTAILNGRPGGAVLPLLAAAGCSLVGLIHSPLPGAPMAWPDDVWRHLAANSNVRLQYQSPFHWAAAYLLAAAVMVAAAFLPAKPGAEAQEKTAQSPIDERQLGS
jgi:adenine/guanine/hypoxanthine permease